MIVIPETGLTTLTTYNSNSTENQNQNQKQEINQKYPNLKDLIVMFGSHTLDMCRWDDDESDQNILKSYFWFLPNQNNLKFVETREIFLRDCEIIKAMHPSLVFVDMFYVRMINRMFIDSDFNLGF